MSRIAEAPALSSEEDARSAGNLTMQKILKCAIALSLGCIALAMLCLTIGWACEKRAQSNLQKEVKIYCQDDQPRPPSIDVHFLGQQGGNFVRILAAYLGIYSGQNVHHQAVCEERI